MDKKKSHNFDIYSKDAENWIKLLKRIKKLEIILSLFIIVTSIFMVVQSRMMFNLQNTNKTPYLHIQTESKTENNFPSNGYNEQYPQIISEEENSEDSNKLEKSTYIFDEPVKKDDRVYAPILDERYEALTYRDHRKNIFFHDENKTNAITNLDSRFDKKNKKLIGKRYLLENELKEVPPNDCNGTLIRIDIYLDLFPFETYWELVPTDDRNSNVITSQGYEAEDENSLKSFQLCLKSGQYTFTLYDSWGDGITCRTPHNCYNIYLDNKLALAGPPFSDFTVYHEINLSQNVLCPMGFEFLLEVESDYFDSSNSNEIIWMLRNEANKKEEVLTQSPQGSQSLTAPNIESYFACIAHGKFTFRIFDINGNDIFCQESLICYRLFLDESSLLLQVNQVQSVFSTSNHTFIVTRDGVAKEQVCSMLNDLSPAHPFNGYNYDEYLWKRLGVINSVSSAESIQDRSTSQSKAACWILIDDLLSDVNDSESTISDLWLERYAFAVFLFSVNGKINSLNMNICEFDYIKVICNEDGRVIELDYFDFKLQGTIPPELSLLRHLENLDVGLNELDGTIPHQLGRLYNLKSLHLDRNKLTGTIPSLLGRLKRLEELLLSGNSLKGEIPTALGQNTNLRRLDLGNNDLIGPIPNEIFDCIHLKSFIIKNNSLTGKISSKFGNLVSLIDLDIELNLLSGSIPNNIWELSSLKHFILDKNKLSGSLPVGIGMMTSLELLVASSNFLTGSLPPINKSSNLKTISLENNQLTGEIPISYYDLDLNNLWLQQNDIVGDIPSDFCEKLPGGLHVDDRAWLLHEPKVNCSCCNKAACHFWDLNESDDYIRPCPKDNTRHIEAKQGIQVIDFITNEVRVFDDSALNEFGANFCLSGTGCYKMIYKDSNHQVFNEDKEEHWEYIESKNKFVRGDVGHGCASVKVCGTSIDKSHPRRIGLNQFTQLVITDMSILDKPLSPGYNALCWAMTQDELYDDYDYCDGTLVQRFVLIYFYYSHNLPLNYEKLASKSTCDWPGISCDPLQKFVTGIDFNSRNLTGSLMTEIGLFTTLKEINLSNNTLMGTIDESIMLNLRQIKIFNVGENQFGGTFPYEVLSHSKLEEYNISNNNFVGSLPDFVYSRDLAVFDVSNNLFQGTIPPGLINCKNLTFIDLSRNNFNGNIPTEIGTLYSLKSVKLYENNFVGSIPIEIFDLIHIEKFMLQSNKLTGSIPRQIGNFENAIVITLNHNQLKGSIPEQLENLSKIEILHFHHNQLVGEAPKIVPVFSNLVEKQSAYITDCGDPSYKLPSQLSCSTCTMCCNSEGKCQEKPNLKFYIWVVLVLISPFAFTLLTFFTKVAKTTFEKRDPMSIYCDDTVYCFILTKNISAMIVHWTTALLQTLLFVQYLSASRFQSDTTDWQFTFICSNNEWNCGDENSRNYYGWFLFLVVTFGYLGVDFIMGILQIQQAIYMSDVKLLLSGCMLLSLTLLGTIASFMYNIALADSNTALIANAVILLFINDLDEKMLDILQALVPEWTEERLREAKDSMSARTTSAMSQRTEKNAIDFTYGEETNAEEYDNEAIFHISSNLSESQNHAKASRKSSFAEESEKTGTSKEIEIPHNSSNRQDDLQPSLILPVLYSSTSPTSDSRLHSTRHIVHRDYFDERD